MQKYEAIENGIANNDIKALREAIGNIIYTNRDFSNGDFFEAIKYVESKGINIKDAELTGLPTISSQKKEYTDEDFARAIFQLKKNFCDERIKDVKTIGESLYGSKKITSKEQIKSTSKETSTKKRSAGTVPNSQSHQKKTTPIVVIGLVAVVGIIVLVCLLAMK